MGMWNFRYLERHTLRLEPGLGQIQRALSADLLDPNLVFPCNTEQCLCDLGIPKPTLPAHTVNDHTLAFRYSTLVLL